MSHLRTMQVKSQFESEDLTPEVLADLQRELNVIGVKLCVGLKLYGLAFTVRLDVEGAPELRIQLQLSEYSQELIDAMNAVDGSVAVPDGDVVMH